MHPKQFGCTWSFRKKEWSFYFLSSVFSFLLFHHILFQFFFSNIYRKLLRTFNGSSSRKTLEDKVLNESGAAAFLCGWWKMCISAIIILNYRRLRIDKYRKKNVTFWFHPRCQCPLIISDSEAIYNPKKLSFSDSLTHSLNNIGLRDASAYKYYSAFFKKYFSVSMYKHSRTILFQALR